MDRGRFDGTMAVRVTMTILSPKYSECLLHKEKRSKAHEHSEADKHILLVLTHYELHACLRTFSDERVWNEVQKHVRKQSTSLHETMSDYCVGE